MQHLVQNYCVNNSDKHRASLSSLWYTGAFPWFSSLTRNEGLPGNYSYLGNVSFRPKAIFSGLIKRTEPLLNKNHRQMEMEAS